MLTRDEVQVLIVIRVMAACDSCNSHHINHVEGQIRGLMAVLLNGAKFDLYTDACNIFDAAGIPWKPHPDSKDGEGAGWYVEDQWLIDRGCTVNGNKVSHPKLKDWC